VLNIKYYENIFEEFRRFHPYIADDVVDYRPKGEHGLRIVLRDGVQYDYHSNTRTVRRVDDRPMYDDSELNEERWRMIFADRLNELIGVRGYSQNTLAENTGLSKGAINNYVNGNATPSAYALSKLARALDCTIAELTE
jgi:ribosome-binding protein aMBF1 (putative translation factor)